MRSERSERSESLEHQIERYEAALRELWTASSRCTYERINLNPHVEGSGEHAFSVDRLEIELHVKLNTPPFFHPAVFDSEKDLVTSGGRLYLTPRGVEKTFCVLAAMQYARPRIKPKQPTHN